MISTQVAVAYPQLGFFFFKTGELSTAEQAQKKHLFIATDGRPP